MPRGSSSLDLFPRLHKRGENMKRLEAISHFLINSIHKFSMSAEPFFMYAFCSQRNSQCKRSSIAIRLCETPIQHFLSDPYTYYDDMCRTGIRERPLLQIHSIGVNVTTHCSPRQKLTPVDSAAQLLQVLNESSESLTL
jgi:hypothetical protein